MPCITVSALGIYNMIGEQAVPQGADWDVSIIYVESGTALDFSGYSARMQIRVDYGKALILELSTTAGTISVGAGTVDTVPNVVLHFTNTATSALSQYSGIYDLELTSPTGKVYKFVKGAFELEREVTI